MTWRAAPLLSTLAVVLTALRGVALPARLLAMGALVTALTETHDTVPVAIAWLVIWTVVQSLTPSLTDPLSREIGRQVDLELQRRLMVCVAAPTGTAHLEEPRTQDLVAKAQGIADRGSTPGGSVAGFLNLMALKLTGVGSVLLLMSFRWWLGLGVAIGAAVIRRWVLAAWFSTAEALMGDVTGLRRAEYLRDLTLQARYAKENRLFGLGGWLMARHYATWIAAMEPVWERRRRVGRTMIIVDLAVLGLALIAAVPIVLGLMSGELGTAQAVILAGALGAITALGGFLPNADFPIRYGCAALPPLLELEAQARDEKGAERNSARAATAGPHSADGSIEFRDVSFRYPRTDGDVLKHLDLVLPAGSTTALVGANGAGKTTLIKLLLRFHEPVSGAVMIDGVDIRTMEPDDWRRRVAVVFQDFARYELPARDNVGFGALELADDTEALRSAAEQAGILDLIERAPRGWDSPLSREYRDGVDLSGGEWQRVALARAMMAIRTGAGLLVLDEPTASLDVRAEAEFYDRILDQSTTTTILVSHRFSTVRRADRICVVSDGRITETGTHDELVDLGGTYSRMFRLQAARFSHA